MLFKLMAQTVVPTTATVVYTVLTGGTTRFEGIILTNTSTNVNANVKVYIVQSGDTVGVKNITLNANLGFGETLPFTCNTNMPAGTTVQIVTDQAGVVGATLSGVEV